MTLQLLGGLIKASGVALADRRVRDSACPVRTCVQVRCVICAPGPVRDLCVQLRFDPGPVVRTDPPGSSAGVLGWLCLQLVLSLDTSMNYLP